MLFPNIFLTFIPPPARNIKTQHLIQPNKLIKGLFVVGWLVGLRF